MIIIKNDALETSPYNLSPPLKIRSSHSAPTHPQLSVWWVIQLGGRVAGRRQLNAYSRNSGNPGKYRNSMFDTFHHNTALPALHLLSSLATTMADETVRVLVRCRPFNSREKGLKCKNGGSSLTQHPQHPFLRDLSSQTSGLSLRVMPFQR